MKAAISSRALQLGGWIVLLPLAVTLGGAGAVVGFFGMAIVTTKIPLLSIAGLAFCFCVATAAGELAGRLISRAHRHRVALSVGCGTVLLATLVASMTLFKPLVRAEEIGAREIPAGVEFWELPTGSRIAYRRVRAAIGTGKAPVIYLHGGPGAGVVSVRELVDAFSFPVRLGHDVYLYDQIGGGLSGRLVDVSAYTVELHLADLEAIRERIGATTIVLIGESWGAELATLYLATHPDRVEKLILISPGSLYPMDWGDIDPCDLKGRASADVQEQFVFLKRPRVAAAALLAEVNPRAAHALLPDDEGDAFVNRLLSRLLPGGVCHPEMFPRDMDFGFGFWGTIMADEDNQRRSTRVDDSLAKVKIPVLILRGACDYCIPEVALQYEKLLAGSSLVQLDGAGHFVWLEKPDDLARIAGTFLSGD